MEFRKITAIIHPDRLEAVETQLRQLGVPGVSVTKVKGFGEYTNFYTPDWMCSHVRIEIFIEKAKADLIASTIIDAAHAGIAGDGIVAVLPVESIYRIRTKEKCTADIC